MRMNDAVPVFIQVFQQISEKKSMRFIFLAFALTAFNLLGCSNSVPTVGFLTSMVPTLGSAAPTTVDQSASANDLTSTNGRYKLKLSVHSGTQVSNISSTNNLYKIEHLKTAQ